jgi:hypothetical protein
MRRALARWRARGRRLGKQWAVIREEWQVEREVERVVAGDGPILAGPWLSEVGYEALYWVPFLRWLCAAYRIAPARLIAMSRGGTASWYADIASRYVEVFDHASPADLARRAAEGHLKQRDISEFDRRLIADAAGAAGWRDVRVLHPSMMFQWFAPFWSGQEGVGFVDRHTRFARVTAPEVAIPVQLPDEYVAVKFYAARALPDDASNRAQVQALVGALAERWPIVQLDTGFAVDEHADYQLGSSARVISLAGRLDPRTNLAVQTRIVAGARLFAGTCGSLAWLAPLLGVATIPVFTDAEFLHAHLHVARRAYGRVGGIRFSPLDISGVADAGLAIAGAGGLTAGSRVS